MSRKHGSLPNLTLLDLAVAEHGIYTIVFFVKLARKRHTACSRYTLSQRTGAHVDAGSALHVGVSLEHSADVAQDCQLIPVSSFQSKKPFSAKTA